MSLVRIVELPFAIKGAEKGADAKASPAPRKYRRFIGFPLGWSLVVQPEYSQAKMKSNSRAANN
jgi:hypothetical protein